MEELKVSWDKTKTGNYLESVTHRLLVFAKHALLLHGFCVLLKLVFTYLLHKWHYKRKEQNEWTQCFVSGMYHNDVKGI